MKLVETAAEAIEDPAYYKALTELLFQLADDDFIVSFRGSEWLGLAPHIEEDVAFSSITQNTMGHAVLFYDLLEDLGAGKADVLAHERPSEARRNGAYLERRNGEGTYLKEPYFDWALVVVRQYLYEVFKRIKLEALTSSSYVPLANISKRILMEQSYHIAHWELWIKQLQESTEEAQLKISGRLEEAWESFLDVLELGPSSNEMVQNGLIIKEDSLKEKWHKEVTKVIQSLPATPLGKASGSGRSGEHTEDLDHALVTLSEVYNSDQAAVW